MTRTNPVSWMEGDEHTGEGQHRKAERNVTGHRRPVGEGATRMMSPKEVEARFQRIEALQASNAEHIAMLLEDAKTRNADIERLIDETRLLNEQARAAREERDQDAQNIRALARIAEAHEHRISRLEGEDE
ncbi:MAG: hypothetical protein U0R19_16160 [Bryobacteraceae bacterium]